MRRLAFGPGARRVESFAVPVTHEAVHDRAMRVVINGINLPGRAFCRPDGTAMENVHVGVQWRREAAQLVRADATGFSPFVPSKLFELARLP